MPVPLGEYLQASGVRVRAGETGLLYKAPSGGRIYCSKASVQGIDENLWAVLKMAAWDLGLAFNVNSVDTGIHSPNSRHFRGLAVDINKVGEDAERWEPATLENRSAMRLYFWLRSAGFRIGERAAGQSVPGVLFGAVGHRYNPSGASHAAHLHVSIVARHKKQGP
jgi:hypothetical protein